MGQYTEADHKAAREEGRWSASGLTYEQEVAKAKAELEAVPVAVEPWPEEPAHPPFPVDAFSQVLGWLRWYTNDDDETTLWYARIPLETQLWEMGGPRPEWEFGPAGNVQRRED